MQYEPDAMNKMRKSPFIDLTKKTIAVITTSLGLLSANQIKALPQNTGNDNSEDQSKNENLERRPLKPKLILKLKSHNPDDYMLAGHSSHSSHASHSSHRSHYSSSSGGDDDGGGGLGWGVLVVGGLVALGAYQLGKNKNKK
jgi:hypothetical protein